MTGARINVTAEARAALLRVRAEHGPVMFHTSGGRVGGRQYPVCLTVGSLRLGARDHLLGTVEGVPIYDMEDREGFARAPSDCFILDVAPGHAIGFSIPAGPGWRFMLTQTNGAACGGV